MERSIETKRGKEVKAKVPQWVEMLLIKRYGIAKTLLYLPMLSKPFSGIK